MTTLTLILALLTHQPEGLREKPETVCRMCRGWGFGLYFQRVGAWRVPLVLDCCDCDGYGREKTIYGRLLKERR